MLNGAIDAHLHLWDTSHLTYDWLATVPRINRPKMPAEIMPQMADANVAGAVFVQAECRADQAVDEALWVAGQAEGGMPIFGIVAWAPLDRGAAAASTLDRLSEIPLVRGIRQLIQDQPDPEFCLRDGFLDGVRLLARYGLSFDICIRAHQFEAVLQFAARCPEIPMVLDHLGKPPIADGNLDVWTRQIRELAAMDHVSAKLSGLATEAGESWTNDDIKPCLDVALEAFGPNRLMVGSDWPVCTLATSYAQWFDLAADTVSALSEDEQNAIFRGTAAQFYRLMP